MPQNWRLLIPNLTLIYIFFSFYFAGFLKNLYVRMGRDSVVNLIPLLYNKKSSDYLENCITIFSFLILSSFYFFPGLCYYLSFSISPSYVDKNIIHHLPFYQFKNKIDVFNIIDMFGDETNKG